MELTLSKENLYEEDYIYTIWEEVLIILENRILNKAAFDTWIKPLNLYKVDNKIIFLSTNSEFVKTTVNSRYSKKILEALKLMNLEEYTIKIILEDEIKEGKIKKPKQKPNNDTLLPKYIFENFVKGKCNEFAYAASYSVAEDPGFGYNPLFLHGNVGLGKTHLMHSIGNYILYHNPNAKILYTTSENLMNEFVFSIRTNKNQEFRDKYRTLDVLLVDDIQFLLDKEGLQEEFFHTFNALYNHSKQIVLTSDKHPLELKTLEDRLRSRFGSGLIVDVTLPDLETRIAILQKFVEASKRTIDKEIIYYIAKSIPSNIRELEGALNTVLAKSKLTKGDITIDFTKETLQEAFKMNEKQEISVPFIQEVVSKFYNINIEELKGIKRNKEIAFARHVAMHISRMLIDCSLKEIGKFFNGRDHSTVVHACDKITNDMEENIKLKQEVTELVKKIKQD